MMKTQERYQLDVVALRDLYRLHGEQGPAWLYLSELPWNLSLVTGTHEAELDLDIDALSPDIAEEIIGLLLARQPERNPEIPPGINRSVVLCLFEYGILTHAKQAS
jgi:hypothetical protein